MDKIEKNNKTFYELILNLPLTAEFIIYTYVCISVYIYIYILKLYLANKS